MGLISLPTPWNGTAIALLVAAGVLLVGSFAFAPYTEQRLGRMGKRFELAQSCLLVGLAAVLWRAAASTALEAAGLLLAAGMLLGFIGDLFMAGVFGKDQVAAGMGAFAAGHLFYALAFRQYALIIGLAQPTPFLAGIVGLWILAILIWALSVRGRTEAPALEWAALGYGVVLAGVAGIMMGLALQQPVFWPLAVGGLLFYISDSLIAQRIFTGRCFRYLGDLIWTTYILAQALIVTSLACALGLL
jgi:uncharacterized membrane protein YhhN